MANYVKFMRGTIDAYEQLPIKDMDTLYFLSDSNGNEGQLYLGTKFIAGSDENEGVINLSDLQDVLITSGLNYDALLVYDPINKCWSDFSFDALVFSAASENHNGTSGFVPAPTLADKNRFLRGDGTWADITSTPSSTSKAQIFEIITTLNETHSEALVRVTKGKILNTGDIAIVKDIIALDRYQYTSYVYNGITWTAMNGNYNAENVYFDEDFHFTEPVGTVTIPASGRQKVAAAGKNIKQFVESLFVEEKIPQITEPYVTINPSGKVIYEVGEEITPAYIGGYYEGKYEFDSSTGVTPIEWKATDSRGYNSKTNSMSSTFDNLIIDDATQYSMTLQAALSDGNIPHTNLGNYYVDGQLKERIYEATSGLITGYRKTFWGSLMDKNELTNDVIRNLTCSSSSYSNGSQFTIDITQGAKRVVIAYPSTLQNITSVLDTNDSNANIVSGFGDPIIMQISGANNRDAIDYKVYIMDFANPYDTFNTFKVTI